MGITGDLFAHRDTWADDCAFLPMVTLSAERCVLPWDDVDGANARRQLPSRQCFILLSPPPVRWYAQARGLPCGRLATVMVDSGPYAA